MKLLIAFLLMAQMDAPEWTYPIVVLLWVGSVIWDKVGYIKVSY